MTYRDDLAATQARADALEREIGELRKRNAELEARDAEDSRTRETTERRGLLALAELREQVEQARRDAQHARREADGARHAARRANDAIAGVVAVLTEVSRHLGE